MLSSFLPCILFFLFNAPSTTVLYTLSLHDALPIFSHWSWAMRSAALGTGDTAAGQQQGSWRTCALSPESRRVYLRAPRSEEHTSELQSRFDLVCRLLLEKKNRKTVYTALYKSSTST